MALKSITQTLKKYVKYPWQITGPCSGPEYLDAVPKATEYRVFCPATTPLQAIIPSSEPHTVFDIKYFNRDQRRNRPPVKRTVLKKDDVAPVKGTVVIKDDVMKMMSETTFDVKDFPQPYLTMIVEEDMDTIGGGYCK